eukprot:CAMPEP_0204511386 /NCGR_PEP_ID=MMETSP0661-20131031/398_1 /ASSEMBLY_ACC=CAM_ASM_000606 /TAXON_ID=109239 /ORGANISM="Alexandrium margalefi, Strain AMGDE01CS-322" /LENGTH=39 /DNA_ID= /DNA_START= /DNA_END= /DNA_ORIENTATION=
MSAECEAVTWFLRRELIHGGLVPPLQDGSMRNAVTWSIR